VRFAIQAFEAGKPYGSQRRGASSAEPPPSPRVKRDPAFAEALRDEAAMLFLKGKRMASL
jgi:hypothetical protein